MPSQLRSKPTTAENRLTIRRQLAENPTTALGRRRAERRRQRVGGALLSSPSVRALVVAPPRLGALGCCIGRRSQPLRAASAPTGVSGVPPLGPPRLESHRGRPPLRSVVAAALCRLLVGGGQPVVGAASGFCGPHAPLSPPLSLRGPLVGLVVLFRFCFLLGRPALPDSTIPDFDSPGLLPRILTRPDSQLHGAALPHCLQILCRSEAAA
jgi:hypothetical protein